MKVFYCAHITNTEPDGKVIQGPYIYLNGGIGKPHYCIRVNRRGYIFLIPDANVPSWFTGNVNVRDLGNVDSAVKLKTAEKTLINNSLGIMVLGNDSFGELWTRILKRTFTNGMIDLQTMIKRIELGEKHYIDVSA